MTAVGRPSQVQGRTCSASCSVPQASPLADSSATSLGDHTAKSPRAHGCARRGGEGRGGRYPKSLTSSYPQGQISTHGQTQNRSRLGTKAVTYAYRTAHS